MKNLNRLFLPFLMTLGIAIGVFLDNQTFAEQKPVNAELVKIMPDFKGKTVQGFHVDPAITNIKKGTMVLWMNGVPGQEVQVIFEDGKTCRDISANPSQKFPGFFLDARSCYVTSFLPYTGTSVLQFTEEGSYEYDVVTEDGKMNAKGQIVVKD